MSERSDGTNEVVFTPSKLKELKELYQWAVEKEADGFAFDGHIYLTGYAKYLIEYLESQFP